MRIYHNPFLKFDYTDEDVEYVEQQRKFYGVMYQLVHPLTEEGMLYEGDCFYCDDHSNENLMCVSSLPKYRNISLFSVCKHCFELHTFIVFNHGNDKIVNCVEN